MARYVLFNRLGRTTSKDDVFRSADATRSFLQRNNIGATVLSAQGMPAPAMRTIVVFEAEPEEIAVKAALVGEDMILEPEMYYYYDAQRPAHLNPRRPYIGAPPIAPMAMQALSAAAPPARFDLHVTGAGSPLANAQVLLWATLPTGQARDFRGHTDAAGFVRITFPSGLPVDSVIVLPEEGFWNMLLVSPSSGGSVDCPALPMVGPLSWWQAGANVLAPSSNRGEGIRVGVIDTGLGPHANLAHATVVGAFIGGAKQPPAAGADVDNHGTHVAGIIGARPLRAGEYAGVAPGCELMAVRVFAGPDTGASNADIVAAIDELSINQRVHLINMSLGGPSYSQGIRDAVIRAQNNGTLSICAAGNSAGMLDYPAGYGESVGVSALGRGGEYPAGTLSAARVPSDSTMFGVPPWFLANFSCYGSGLDCAAPGVGIISTVPVGGNPRGGYAGMDGTSQASPLACGTLAALLSADAPYRAMAPTVARAALARQILVASLKSFGLGVQYEAGGVPQLP